MYLKRQELDEEVEWVETLLNHILNAHSKSMRVTLFSKKWWNKEVEARKIWAKEKKRWGKITPDREKLKQAPGDMQKNFDLSTGLLSEEVRRDWEFEFGVFMMGMWLRTAYFS